MVDKKLDTGTGAASSTGMTGITPVMVDKKLDTGTGGIDINGKVHTYDVGVESDEFDDVDYSSGLVNVDKAKRDLSRRTRVTLGQYLSNTTTGDTRSVPEQTQGGGNRFPVVGEVKAETPEFSTTDNKGYPVGPQPVSSDAFEPDLSKIDSASSTSRSTLPKSTWRGDPNISRGMLRRRAEAGQEDAAEKDRFDGNDLLRVPLTPAVRNTEVLDTIPEGHPVKTYSSSLIRNRWTTDNRFGEVSSPSTPLGALSYKSGLSYTPEDYLKPENILVTQRQLAAVGNVLMARASGELTSENAEFDPTSGGFQALATLLPGSAQVLIKRVREDRLSAEDVLQSLDLTLGANKKITAGIDEREFLNITGATPSEGTMLSWGALNNPYDQFSGFSALGMQILAIAFVITITLIPTLVSFAFNTAGEKKQTKDARGRDPIGRYRVTKTGIPNLSIGSIVTGFASGQLDWADLIGFSTTIFPLNQTINTGLLVFFGLDPFAQSTFFRALAPSGPEAYLVFSRAIFRSFLGIADQLKGMAQAVSQPGGELQFIQRILSFIEYLRGARIMRALNTFSLLGDQILNEGGPDAPEEDPAAESTVTGPDGKPVKVPVTGGFGGGKRKSSIDNLPIDGRSAYLKSRLIDTSKSEGAPKNLRLAWSSFRAPDMLIMPSGMQSARALGGNLGAPTLTPTIEVDEKFGLRNGGPYRQTDTGRISSVDRAQMENVLDGEYMPFYFHDIRTNEIISFHAFLTSLGDAYTAAYDSSDAIGRVESIKTYKGTARKIDVSFIAAALSEQDFDSMWLKLNKLTTMVYPQFSAGKLSAGETYDVTIPFSQQIIASPMIRLRIGDLIQSNYSRFNLARLFGYASPTFRLKDGEKKAEFAKFKEFAATPDFVKKYNEALAAKKAKGGKFYYSGEIKNDNSGYAPLKKGTRLPPGLLVQTTEPGLAKIIKDDAYKGETLDDLTLFQFKDVDVAVDPDSLRPSAETERECFKAAGGDDAAQAFDYQELTEIFMNTNSIVRSFESSGGRGIAGFIESLSFDWYSSTTWETQLGRRTPKMCKVTLSFSPTHDITPGLDFQGANRAPIYPVGPHRPRQ